MQYFYINIIGKHGIEYHLREGKKIKIKGFENETFYLHLHDGARRHWIITEEKTGCLIVSHCNTQKEAIQEAEQRLKEHSTIYYISKNKLLTERMLIDKRCGMQSGGD